MATIIERIGKTGKPSYRVQIRHHSKFLKTMGSFQIPVDSFSEPLAVIGWQSQP